MPSKYPPILSHDDCVISLERLQCDLLSWLDLFCSQFVHFARKHGFSDGRRVNTVRLQAIMSTVNDFVTSSRVTLALILQKKMSTAVKRNISTILTN